MHIHLVYALCNETSFLEKPQIISTEGKNVKDVEYEMFNITCIFHREDDVVVYAIHDIETSNLAQRIESYIT